MILDDYGGIQLVAKAILPFRIPHSDQIMESKLASPVITRQRSTANIKRENNSKIESMFARQQLNLQPVPGGYSKIKMG